MAVKRLPSPLQRYRPYQLRIMRSSNLFNSPSHPPSSATTLLPLLELNIRRLAGGYTHSLLYTLVLHTPYHQQTDCTSYQQPFFHKQLQNATKTNKKEDKRDEHDPQPLIRRLRLRIRSPTRWISLNLRRPHQTIHSKFG